ncbi:hypothetical protein FRB95_000783 [Tulasnella sp. JGI-2019a]|nr:hypothetical protein FRB95_000783 [Tulasnella sp. JGI-2019a]
MVSLWLALLLASPLVRAFSDSSPLVAWSSTPSEFSSTSEDRQLVIGSDDVLNASYGDLCAHDAVIVVEQPGLHASDLRTLSPNSYVAQQLHSAPSSQHVPYVTPAFPVGYGQSIGSICEMEDKTVKMAEVMLGQNVDSLPDSGKQLIRIELPELEGVGQQRREEMRKIEEKLSLLLAKLLESFPSHVVLIAGTTPSLSNKMKRHIARSHYEVPVAFRSPRAPSSASGVKPRATSGIFHRYQLLTPGLITTIGITFLLIMPLMLMVISAVAGIKSPLRSEGFKQSGQEKKNQ